MSFNSTIMDKYTLCCDCNDGILKPTIAGRCKNYHYSIYRKKLLAEKQKEKQKVRSLINSKPNKELLVKNEKIVNVELELWYLARKYEMTGRCSEEGCKNGTNKWHDKYFRWSCCHIVPKGLVPSVAVHYSNFIELCQIHHQEYDAGFERSKRMKCFKIAKAAFDTFKHLIPLEEMRKVNPYLLQPDATTEPPCTINNNQKQDD